MSSHQPSSLEIHAAWEKPVVAASGGEATLIVRIKASDSATHTGQRRAPVDLAFVLDRSGSMAGEELRLVKEAVSVAAGYLRDEDRAALVVYDHDVDLLQPLAPTTPRMKTGIRLALQGVDAGGSTNLSGGWLAGCDQLATALNEPDRSSAIRIRRTLLLTDGHANVGITDPTELTKHAHELRKRGISTTAIGVGDGFNEVLLSGMVEAGGGNFQYVRHSGELHAFFQEELGELLTIVAAGFSLTLTLPHGVRARLVNAFPVDRNGKQITVSLRDFAPDAEVILVFDVTVKPGARGATHVASIQAAWSDPASDQRVSYDQPLPPIQLVDRAAVESTPSDPDVAAQAAVERSQAMHREAMRLDREGRYAESRARLQEGASLLAAAPTTAYVQEMRMEANTLAAYDLSPLTEDVRKSTTFRAMRRSRGKRDEGGDGR